MMDLLYKFALTADEVGVPTTSSNDLLVGILNIVYFIAGSVAVIVIITAGIMMTVQGDSPDKILKRKHMIGDAAAGLAVVLLAFTITQFVLGRF